MNRSLRPAGAHAHRRADGSPARTLLSATLLAVLVAGSGCRTLAGQTGPGEAARGGETALEERIRGRLDALDAVSSLYALHLPTGREIAIRADDPMNTLSVIKIAAMVRAHQLAEAGRLDLARRRVVEEEDMRGGSGLLRTFDPGLRPTVGDLVTQMIITSDNTATDMVVDEVGLEEVNGMLDSLGYDQTRFLRSTGDLFTRFSQELEAAEARERQGFDPEEASFRFQRDSTAWLGRSTARETGRFLEALVDGRLAGEEATAAMLRTLGRQFYRSRLPRYLADGVQVAHKTGDWPPHAGNDVGLLLHDGGPTVVAIYVNENRGDFLEVERAMGRIAEDLVSTWGGPGG